MQFVANGPEIPDSLLQAQEEGRVVFFCGAGISYPAGLPGFRGLVDEIYKRVGTTRLAIEQEAYDRNQFDATLDLLERRLPGQRIAVRRMLAEALKPKWHRKGATETHEALLELARSRDGSIRLVTTNFDRVFERVGKRPGKTHQAYAAPMLPIPKNSRWNGLVYLHGLLPNKADDSALHRLVLTSGDFGLAYLTERWAARFVSELFRNYVVCFVGYSINDPVLRYMMDALAADRMLGEVTPQAYALGDCEPGQEGIKTIEWSAKGVSPILYEVPAGSHNHSALHKTLRVWAETYRDGTLGKERIVAEYALARPSASTRQDDFVGRMLWALSHESGLPAKRFAEFNPVPALDWLEAFSDERYLHGDLERFGVSPLADVDKELRFSLIQRPAPYRHAPRMALMATGGPGSEWDDVMFYLARWLVRHLNDPALIIWLAQRGDQLHHRWSSLIEHQLDRIARLARERKTGELDDIRSQAPNAIPEPRMQTLWRLLLTGRVKAPWRAPDLYSWEESLKGDGLSATLRLRLRELLSPKVILKKPLRGDEEDTDEPTRIRQLVDWELVLAADYVHTSLREMTDESWRTALPLLLDDFNHLLRDALDLLRELGEADDSNDRSRWDLPSISPHWQNRGFREWVALIELTRDAWLETRKSDPERARRIALGWFDLPYPTFKRLALFAASQPEAIDPTLWAEWLVSDNGKWLWSAETRRETLRLLVQQGAKLSPSARTKLETAILAGPPRHIYRDDLEPGRLQSQVDHSVWLHLAKLQHGGGQLGGAASHRIDKLSAENPDWRLAINEQDEFTIWMSGTGDPDYEDSRDVDIAPRKRADLVRWLKQPQPETRSFFYEDTWRETCRTRFFHSLLALCDLAQEQIWHAERWKEALQAWSEDSRVLRSWRYAAPLIQNMPEAVMKESAHSVTQWMEATSKVIDRHETILLHLCTRVLALPFESNVGIRRDEEPINEPITEAINHPIGHVVQALLNFWFKRKPNDNDLLPGDIEPFFTQMCDIEIERYRHGRVLLASRLITLFRVDRSWTEKYLLPLFDWLNNPVEARAAWIGFLWSPRLYRPLQIAFKAQFLSTAHRYMDLGEHRGQFAAFLTYAALDPVEGYASADFQAAVGVLPTEGLQEVARTLSHALESAGEQREDYWRNRVQPFWQQVWPKSRNLASSIIAESLALLCIAGGDEFRSILNTVVDWLQPIAHSHRIVHRLHASGLCARFPEPALRLLDAVLANQPWAPRDLGQCLEAIAQAMPDLQQDHRYQRLAEYARRHTN